MKILKKIIIVLCVFCITLSLRTAPTYATIMTRELLEKSAKGYFNGEKTASATLSNGTKITLGDNQSIDMVFREDTITSNTYNYTCNYTISEEDNTISFSCTTDIVSNEQYTDKMMMNYIGFPLFFVSVTDIYGIDSNKSFYYFAEEVMGKQPGFQTIPEGVDINNGVSYMKWLASSTNYFANINNSVFSYYFDILENNDNQFKYITNLKINLDNLNEIEGNKVEENKTQENKKDNVQNTANNNTVNTNNNNQNITKTTDNLPKTGESSIIKIFLF